MNEQRQMHIIENTIETTLSGLTPDPFLAQRVAQGIRVKGSNMKTKKKIPLSAVLVNAAVLAAVALLLFGLGPARQNMQKNDPPSGVLQPLTALPSPSAQPLTAEEERSRAAEEIRRVLKPGGRISICDIVIMKQIPEELQNDPSMHSC